MYLASQRNFQKDQQVTIENYRDELSLLIKPQIEMLAEIFKNKIEADHDALGDFIGGILRNWDLLDYQIQQHNNSIQLTEK